jgi:hypothetical protein
MSATETQDRIIPPTSVAQNDVADEPGSIASQIQTCQQQPCRKRKHSELAVTDSDVRELTPKSTPGEEAVHDVVVQTATQLAEQKYYCTVCKEILPVSAFYPSYMQRHLSWCKSCARIKQVEQKKKKQVNAALTRPAPSPPDHTRSMLERLRRQCSQTCHLEGLSKPLLVGFDAKAARPLLAFWKWQTALQPTVESKDDVALTNVVSRDALSTSSSCIDTLEPGSCNQVSSGLPASAKRSTSVTFYEQLRWIVWTKSDLTLIMPWEVIPVTRKEALLFRNVPIALRSQLVSDNVVQQIERHLQRLRAICLSEPGLAICSLLERYNQFTLAAESDSRKLIQEIDFR